MSEETSQTTPQDDVESSAAVESNAAIEQPSAPQPAHSPWARGIAAIAFLVLLVVSVGVFLYTVRGVIHALILGMLFSLVLQRPHSYMVRAVAALANTLFGRLGEGTPEARLRRRDAKVRSLASLLSVCLFCVMIGIPLWLFGSSVVRQGALVLHSGQKWVRQELPGKLREAKSSPLMKKATAFLAFYEQLKAEQKSAVAEVESDTAENADAPTPAPRAATTAAPPQEIPLDFSKIVGECLDYVREIVQSIIGLILAQTGRLAFNFIVMLLVMYQFFYDGAGIGRYIRSILPLSENAQQQVGSRIKEVARAIVLGIFGMAVIQALLAMVCFWIVGIPPLFWGTILGLCSVIPIVGTSIVWIPAALYLWLIGNAGGAIFLLVACLVANMDFLIRPLLMKHSGDTGLSFIVLFLSIMGGIATFGLLGVIYGPLLAAICSVCLVIFRTQYKERRDALAASTTITPAAGTEEE